MTIKSPAWLAGYREGYDTYGAVTVRQIAPPPEHREAADPKYWRDQGVATGFDVAPYHPFVRVFALDDHEGYYAHVDGLVPYEYDPSIRDKLVLPPDHRDLIDLLTDHDASLAFDLIAGKGRGTIVLALGPPGVGKTLTAEVYAEVIKRPLYSIHAAQLGLDGDTVEKRLIETLSRGARWGAAVLIDEADVYVRRRDNDPTHNAIVASFLRVLERFNGLLFMTSNRSDDVDDAILSRATAIVRYALPSPEEAARLWAVYAEGFALIDRLTAAGLTPTALAARYPAASGRDVRNVLGLAARVLAGNPTRKPDAELIRQCAVFKGIV